LNSCVRRLNATFLLHFSLSSSSVPDRFNAADSGVLIEGWRWGRSKAPPDVEWDSRVTHHSSEFSPDGRLWTVVKDENGLPRVRDISPCPLPPYPPGA